MEKEFIQERSDDSLPELCEEINQQPNEFLNNVPQPDVLVDQELSLYTPPVRRSERVRAAPSRYGFVIWDKNEASIIQDDDPVTYSEAVESIDSDKWLNAMKSEMDSMYSNQVWTLVDPPEGINPIGCKWVFKKKLGADGCKDCFPQWKP